MTAALWQLVHTCRPSAAELLGLLTRTSLPAALKPAFWHPAMAPSQQLAVEGFRAKREHAWTPH